MNKKLFLLLVVLASITFGATAQDLATDLIGTWRAVLKSDDPAAGDSKVTLRLKKDNKGGVTIIGNAHETEEGMSLDIGLTMNVKNTWVLDGNNVVFDYDLKSLMININFMKANGTNIPMDDETKQGLQKQISAEMANHPTEAVPFMRLDNVVMGEKSFTCTIDGTEVTFKR